MVVQRIPPTVTDHRHMARVFMREARSRHGNPAQLEYASMLVRWARDRHYRHIKAGMTGQQELPL